jgi:putative phage-type endonuclease
MTTATAPTGILLGSFTPGTPEWNEARKGLCVTATQIAAIVGLSPWQSAYELWHKKAGRPTAPFTATPEMRWGSRFEDDVAEEFAEQHPEHPLLTTGTWKHQDRDWQRATPDRLWGNRLVEIKTATHSAEWGPSGSDIFPMHYRCQITWQQDTLGLHEPAHLAVLILPYDYREYVVEYDETDARMLREAAERFLRSVRDGEPPEIDGSEHTYNTIRVQPDRYDPVDVEIPGPIASDYEVIGAQHKAITEQYTQAKSRLLAALGTGKNAMHLGRRIAYRVANEDGTTKQLQPAR